MRRIAFLFLVVLGSVMFMHAQSSANQMKLSGTICNSACVTRSENVATCDKDCTDKSGKAVLVDDQGDVKRISDQDQNMCKSHMGKHVKMSAMRMEQPPAAAVPSEKEREEELHIMEIEDATP